MHAIYPAGPALLNPCYVVLFCTVYFSWNICCSFHLTVFVNDNMNIYCASNCLWYCRQWPEMRGAVCIICTEQFDNARDVSALKCGHIFHADCLQAWLIHSMTCPQCRQHVAKTAVIHKLYFSRPDGDDSIVGEPNAAQELSRISSKLEDAQNKLSLREREVAKLSAEMSAKDDRVSQITESHRLPLILSILHLMFLRTTAYASMLYSAYMPRQFRLSVTHVYCIKTAERIIEILSPPDRPIILVFQHQGSLH